MNLNTADSLAALTAWTACGNGENRAPCWSGVRWRARGVTRVPPSPRAGELW